MTQTIPGRETIYNGTAMRSRNEARYAAVLDELGVQWAYEGPCYATRRGQYLPDFSILGLRAELFVEVKANPPQMDRDLLERMRVVRGSLPDAHLAVTCPAWGGAMVLDLGGIVCSAHWAHIDMDGRKSTEPFVVGSLVGSAWSVTPRLAWNWLTGRRFELEGGSIEFPDCVWTWDGEAA